MKEAADASDPAPPAPSQNGTSSGMVSYRSRRFSCCFSERDRRLRRVFVLIVLIGCEMILITVAEVPAQLIADAFFSSRP